ncbi:MAG: glycosyltransferase [Acidimicrobiia bacterium]|nr:glycosyltransferase [Acidimicrobiia bacterium]
MHEVTIRAGDPLRLGEVIGPERVEDLVEAGLRASELLTGRSVVNVNSTATGGGVAEMLSTMLGYVRGTGVDARWVVIDGSPAFFSLTKRIHNHLYGSPGDGGHLGPGEHDLYRTTLTAEGEALATKTEAGDVVVLHDPQTAGLAEQATRLGCTVVWRCHVGRDSTDVHTERAWAFLRPYLEPFVDHYVFTSATFPPSWVPSDQCSIVWPSIDPLSPKNQPLTDEQVEAILTHVGIVAGRQGDRTFTRTDGTPSRVERYCDVFRTGPPAAVTTPMIAQVSRWDGMKDMAGVMEAFARYVDSGRDAELVLAGPVVSAVADDPEGGAVLHDCWEAWRQLPHAIRRRVQLVCIPMHDVEENAAIVNALQRHASVVTQKSIAEGFGLTVAEAMLKGTPVIGTAVGGIVEQIIDGETGLLIDDPHDLGAFGTAVCRLLDEPQLRKDLGERARRRALDVHMVDTHLMSWLDVVASTLGGRGR